MAKTMPLTLLIIAIVSGTERGGKASVPEGSGMLESGLVVGAWRAVVTVTGGGGERGGNFDDSSIVCVGKIVGVHRNFVVVVKVVVVRCVRR